MLFRISFPKICAVMRDLRRLLARRETQFEDLLRNKRLKLKECQSKKTGKVFNSTVILSTENDGKAKFELNFGKEGEK